MKISGQKLSYETNAARISHNILVKSQFLQFLGLPKGHRSITEQQYAKITMPLFWWWFPHQKALSSLV